MNSDIIILHHLGLGDHLITHGAVRKLYETQIFSKMKLVVLERFYSNVSFMFRDLDKLEYIIVSNNHVSIDSVRPQVVNLSGKLYDCWWYGHTAKQFHEEEIYTSLGFKWEDKYNYFKVVRDLDRENYVYSQVVKNDEPYCFVGDDPSRGYVIDVNRAIGDSKLNVIRSHDLLNYTLFDLLKVMENAQSIHVMYNAFFTLVDCMKFNSIYLHNSYLGKVNPLESYGPPMMNFLSARNIKHI